MTTSHTLFLYCNLKEIAFRILGMPYEQEQFREEAWRKISKAGAEIRTCFAAAPELRDDLSDLIDLSYGSAVTTAKIAYNRPTRDFPEKPSPEFLSALHAELEDREGGARRVLENDVYWLGRSLEELVAGMALDTDGDDD